MSARAWLLAARPRTLVASVVPVTVGSAVAHAAGAFRPGPAAAALAGAVAIQVGTNLVNDLGDWRRGADGPGRVGPVRAVESGLLSPRAVAAGAAVAFGLAIVAGVYLAGVAGWPIVAVGTVSILSGVAYTAGPYALAYRGLGDPFVFVFFGQVAVVGTSYVQTGRIEDLAVWAAIPVGAIATAILVVNNVRDRETDARVGKRTLAVRLGRRAGVLEYALLLAAAYLAPAAIAALDLASPWVLASGLSVPLAIGLSRRLARQDGRALNEVLAGTARLLAVHGLLLSAAIAFGP